MVPCRHVVDFAVVQAIYGVWRYDTPLYMGAMAEMMRRRGAPPGDVPKDLPQRQLVRAGGMLSRPSTRSTTPAATQAPVLIPRPGSAVTPLWLPHATSRIRAISPQAIMQHTVCCAQRIGMISGASSVNMLIPADPVSAYKLPPRLCPHAHIMISVSAEPVPELHGRRTFWTFRRTRSWRWLRSTSPCWRG